jgi:hypothetical protein
MAHPITVKVQLHHYGADRISRGRIIYDYKKDNVQYFAASVTIPRNPRSLNSVNEHGINETLLRRVHFITLYNIPNIINDMFIPVKFFALATYKNSELINLQFINADSITMIRLNVLGYPPSEFYDELNATEYPYIEYKNTKGGTSRITPNMIM